MKKKSALLVVSFGTTYPETRGKTIEAIEKDLQKTMPDRRFYRAWTSRFIRKRVLEKEGIQVASVEEALQTMKEDGITDVCVQPTHMLAGREFEQTEKTIREFKKEFDSLRIGRPLLSNEEDIRRFAAQLEQEFSVIPEEEMIVWMGHGSDSLSIPVYDLLNKQFIKDGYPQMCVGTVEYEPGIEMVLNEIRRRRPVKVLLTPMLVVAGDHALNDLAGEDPKSWKNQIQKENAQVTCLVKGLGEYPSIRNLYMDHALHADVLQE